MEQGGTLTIQGGGFQATSLGAATLQGGTGGSGGAQHGGNGDALGGALFIQGTNTATFGAAAGQTTLVADVITDQSGNPGAENFTAGVGSIVINAAGGTVEVHGPRHLYGRHHDPSRYARTRQRRVGCRHRDVRGYRLAETLRFDTGASQLGGSIAGMAIGTDSIDIGFHAFAAGDHAVWSQTSASSGVLSLVRRQRHYIGLVQSQRQFRAAAVQRRERRQQRHVDHGRWRSRPTRRRLPAPPRP